MKSNILNRFWKTAAAMLCTTAVLTLPADVAQSDELSPEDQMRLDKLKAFLQQIDEFLPTVNVIDESKLPITVSFDDVLSHVVVDVSFDGETRLPFMLDTGAPTIISPDLAVKHGGETLVETAAIAGGGKIYWSPMTLVPSATMEAALPIENLTAGTDWSAAGSLYCVTPHGLLGAPTMRNAVWQIDYAKKEVTVAASVDQLSYIDEAIVVPFTTKPGTLSPTPHVQLSVGTGTLDFIVDTGGGIPLTINTADLASVGVELPEDAPTTLNIAGGAAGAFEIPLAAMQLPVGLAGTQIQTTVFVGDGMAPDAAGNMGHEFLKNFVVTFDWSTNTMYLDPINDDGSVDSINDVPAAGVGPDDKGNYVVISLARGGSADQAGLTLGEAVSAINGHSTENMDIDAFCDLMKAGINEITSNSGKKYDAGMIEGFFSARE